MHGAKSYGDDCKAVLQPHFKIIHMTRDKGIQAIIPATADQITNIYSIAALSPSTQLNPVMEQLPVRIIPGAVNQFELLIIHPLDTVELLQVYGFEHYCGHHGNSCTY